MAVFGVFDPFWPFRGIPGMGFSTVLVPFEEDPRKALFRVFKPFRPKLGMAMGRIPPSINGKLPVYHLGYLGSGAPQPMSFVKYSSQTSHTPLQNLLLHTSTLSVSRKPSIPKQPFSLL